MKRWRAPTIHLPVPNLSIPYFSPSLPISFPTCPLPSLPIHNPPYLSLFSILPHLSLSFVFTLPRFTFLFPVSFFLPFPSSCVFNFLLPQDWGGGNFYTPLLWVNNKYIYSPKLDCSGLMFDICLSATKLLHGNLGKIFIYKGGIIFWENIYPWKSILLLFSLFDTKPRVEWMKMRFPSSRRKDSTDKGLTLIP